MKKVIFTLLLAVFFVGTIQAKYTQTCKVKYRANYGWSKYYTVDVTFMSGSELNDATNSYNYDSYKDYAIIFWGKGKASVIKISSYIGGGSEVTQSDIAGLVTNIDGEDQQGRSWEICTSNYCY